MSRLSKLFCGITLLTVPTIQYGGYFLLTLVAGWSTASLTDFQRSMFRSGHAHAGVLVILALVAQFLADHARLPTTLNRAVRIGFPLAAVLVSGGFFGAAAGSNVTQPTPLIAILYAGIGVLALSTTVLGIGLLRSH
ncbi:hypothetical protein [Spirosoma arcticum]